MSLTLTSWILALGLLAGAFISAWFTWKNNVSFVHDDVFITLRYARNWAEGLGPVWNEGELVEGYSSFLAVGLISLLNLFGVELLAASRLVNILGWLGGAAVLAWYAWHHTVVECWRPLTASLAASLIIGSYPLVIWILGGLETPLYVGLIALSLTLMLSLLDEPSSTRRIWAAGLALGALFLVRPDGALFGMVAAIVYLVALIPLRRAAVKLYLYFAVAGTSLPVIHLLIRLTYYGEWLPNTVWSKAMGVPGALMYNGISYVGQFFLLPPYLLVAATIAALVLIIWREQRLHVLYLVTTIGSFAVMIAVVGGDHMPMYRLILPVIPGAILLILLGLRGDTGRPANYGALLVATSLAVGCSFYFQHRNNDHGSFGPLFTDPAAFVGAIMGRHLNETFAPGTSVALNTAGSTPFFAPRLRFIDMLGLNDKQIARRKITRIRLQSQLLPGHAKGDGAYVLDRKPDVIIIGPAEGRDVRSPLFLSDLELKEHPDFSKYYVKRVVKLAVTQLPDWQHKALAKRAFKDSRQHFMDFTYYEKRTLSE